MKSISDRYSLLFFLIILSLAFLYSCGRQEKSPDSQKGTSLINKLPIDSNDVKIKSAIKNEDPLFFIDGQLCQHLRKIFQDSKGNLWFGTNVYGLMRYNGDSLEYFDNFPGLAAGRITGIVEDKFSNLWIAAYGGLSKYDGKTFTLFNEKDGLLNNEIWSLLIDSNNIIWIGTNDGVSRFDGKKFTTFLLPKIQVTDTTTIYSLNRITSIVEDHNGNLWFGTDGFGIYRYNGETFTNFTKEDGLADNVIYELKVDSKGNIWIGTFFGGVSLFDGTKFINFTLEGKLSGVEVCGFYEDKYENIWFAVENKGVYRYDGKTFTNFHKDEGLITNGILCIFEDKEGRFWFGGWGGLFRYDGKSFTPVTKDGPWDI